MTYLVVCAAALVASSLTLFSGFGLGTLLMPVIAIFFPLELAIAMTAVVHLANNLFKLGLLGRHANGDVLLRFGVPAIVASLFGAALLAWLGDIRPVIAYQAFGHDFAVPPLKLLIGGLIIVFVALDLWPSFSTFAIGRRWLPLGGAVSGFFGGLSGHQGALRSLFLLKAGLGKEAFVATGVVLAVMVDVSRMTVYGVEIGRQGTAPDWPLVGAASLAAFAGAWFGAKMLEKVTIHWVQVVVSALLVAVALGLMTGVL